MVGEEDPDPSYLAAQNLAVAIASSNSNKYLPKVTCHHVHINLGIYLHSTVIGTFF